MSNKKTRSIKRNAPPPTEKLEYSYTCFYCQHGFDKPCTSNNSTIFRCGECKVPLFRPSKGNCWQLHILNGVPKKRHLSKIKNQCEKKGQYHRCSAYWVYKNKKTGHKENVFFLFYCLCLVKDLYWIIIEELKNYGILSDFSTYIYIWLK